jgi:hypothetical protein
MMNAKRIPSQHPQARRAARPVRRITAHRRAPRGSVLILVVSLLVLMALIGTAWISTTRVDRANTFQNTHNTQVDLLIEGVANTVKAKLLDDVFDQGLYRRAGGKYDHSDSVISDEFLASRVPVLLDELAPVWTGTPVPPATMPPTYVEGRYVQDANQQLYVCLATHVGDPSNAPGSSALWQDVGMRFDLGTPFDIINNPPVYGAVSRVLPPGARFEDLEGRIPSWTERFAAIPVTWPLPDSKYPALRFFHPDRDAFETVIAADTDGDGAADAFLYKLPVGRLNGLDYYAAIRVVDNNSAVNAATAIGAATPGAGAVASFPSSVNLFNMIVGTDARDIRDQINRLNRARFTDDPRDDLGAAPFNFPPDDDPLSDQLDTLNNRRRGDFKYGSIEELMYFQLIRRMANPGEWTDGDNNVLRMKALPSADLAALLYRGGTLVNPDAMNPDLSPSTMLERLLGSTLYYGAANHPSSSTTMARQPAYPLNDRQTPMIWFGRNFDYRGLWTTEQPNAPQTWRNRRALLTAFNPLSTVMPERFTWKGDSWNDGMTYDVGDWIRHSRNGKLMQFVCINPQVVSRSGGEPPREPFMPPPGGASADPTHPSYVNSWEPQVFETYPTKVSINSASFGRLYLAFWQVMGESTPISAAPPAVQSPFKDSLLFLTGSFPQNPRPNPPGYFDNPYVGRRFVAPAPGLPAPIFPAATHPAYPTVTEQHPMRMFATPLRTVPVGTGFGPTTPRLLQDETIRLRAALAAVNALDMRDGDDNITFQDVTLRASLDRGADEMTEQDDAAVLVRARVYGNEKQPFLTEIFAHTQVQQPGGGTDNPFGYVAVEFYNPHPFPIDLVNCKLATIDRRTATAAGNPPTNPHVVVTDSDLTPTLAPHLSAATSNLASGAGATPAIPATVIPAGGYLVLENYDAIPGVPASRTGEALPATYRPASTGMPPTGAIADPAATQSPMRNYAYVPNLHTVIDKEMVLLRPLSVITPPPLVDLPGTPDVATVTYAPFPGTVPPQAVDMAPLDSFDFTGLPNRDPLVGSAALPTVGQSYAWHYSRASGAGKAWRFVYPGRYDATQSIVAGGLPRPRHQGTFEAGFPAGGGVGGRPASVGWDTGGTAPNNQDPWDPTHPLTRGVRPQPSVTLVETPIGIPVTPPGANASYGVDFEHPIQLSSPPEADTGAAGPYAVGGPWANQYPFGGFARNGDILNVPFIGSYRIKLTGWTAGGRHFGANHVYEDGAGGPTYNMVLELNAITLDSTRAEDTDPLNYPRAADTPAHRTEQIGRFAPSWEDVDVALQGTVTDASAPAAAALGTLEDLTLRQDPNDAADRWNGYEIEIVAGPGKGQVRQVVDYAPGTFVILRGWDAPLGLDSKYILRKGPLANFLTRPTAEPPTPLFLGAYGGTGAYRWSTDLFDFLTVDAPQDDHFPPADPMSYGNAANDPPPPQAVSNTDPRLPAAVTYGRMVGGSGNRFTGTDNLMRRDTFYVNGAIEFLTGAAAGQVQVIKAYTGNNRNIQVFDPYPSGREPLPGDVFRILHTPEDTTPVHGLININTAPWPVLATLPMIPENSDWNTELAQAIARWRDGDPSAGVGANGPFKSVFDLYKVPLVATYQVALLDMLGDPDDGAGDFTPQGAGTTDLVRHDYEENYLIANRISNMVTTRSDTFTCYVLVQGWRGAGTLNPELVVQRRRAFVADRSGVTPKVKEVPLQYFYNE